MSCPCWAILTGEYPPMPGGVADHTQILAEALVAEGDGVHVFVPDHTGPHGLTQLSQRLEKLPRGTRLLVQYTPQAFGWRGMNVPFCLWLRHVSGLRPVDVLFHEVHHPIDPAQPLRHYVLGSVTRWMARKVVQSAQRVFVSTWAWEQILRPMIGPDVPIRLAPTPSNLPTDPSPGCVAAARARITRGGAGALIVGHFGTYGPWFRDVLAQVLPMLLSRPNVHAALIGRGSDDFAHELLRANPPLADRVFATGDLPRGAAAAQLSACDVLVQPYPDGITTRRSSAMGGLALGIATVTTDGPLTEPFWREDVAVAMAPVGNADALYCAAGRLLGDDAARQNLAARGRQTYRARFDLSHTVAALRAF